MPRSRRGGRRSGKPGAQYSNRSDLQEGPRETLPITVASGQAYGQRKAQENAQRAVPMGPPRQPAPAQPAPGGPPAGPVFVPAGTLPFDRPSERPDEPLTAGIGTGAGPGPEALVLPPDARSLDTRQLASYLPALELMASQPGSTVSFRNFVRSLRGSLPLQESP